MQKHFRFTLLAGLLSLGALASCNRANYAFQTTAPAYLGTTSVDAPAATPKASASTPAASTPAPVAQETPELAVAPASHTRHVRHTATSATAAASASASVAGQPLRTEAKVLKKMGLRQLLSAPKEAQEGGKSQLTALLLCIFLGGLGIHQFYLGYTGRGILRLLLFIFGFLIIPAIVNFVLYIIDIIKIANGNLKPRDGDYAKKL